MTEHEHHGHCLDSRSVTRQMDFEEDGVRWLVVTCHCQECGNRWEDHYAHNWSESLDDVKSAAEILAEETGEPIEKFQADDYELPDLDELEAIDAED